MIQKTNVKDVLHWFVLMTIKVIQPVETPGYRYCFYILFLFRVGERFKIQFILKSFMKKRNSVVKMLMFVLMFFFSWLYRVILNELFNFSIMLCSDSEKV